MNIVAAKKKLFMKNKKKCSTCGSNYSVEVHHKDFDPYNNKLSNLQVLCSYHHNEIHCKKGWRRNDPAKRYRWRIGCELHHIDHAIIKDKCKKEGKTMREVHYGLLMLWIKGKVKI